MPRQKTLTEPTEGYLQSLLMAHNRNIQIAPQKSLRVCFQAALLTSRQGLYEGEHASYFLKI